MEFTRRKFVKTAATSVAAAGTLMSTAGAAVAKNRKVKVATIGCGGRSNRDIPNFIKACEMLGLEAEFVALADAFEDKAFEQADKYGVSRDKCIVGWDSYQKVAESDAEFVMLITPPSFRPLHLDTLVDAGKHVLMQKPVAVDAPGCRRVIAAGERAKKKGLRIAVTDRCNLRCFYCMPAHGIPYEPKSHLLSYEEITRLLEVLGGLGFRKVRFTGGEPFLRKDFMKLLENTAGLQAYKSIHITSNGTLLQRHIPRLKALGITKINLSIDSLDAERFHKITRRNDFDKVLKTFHMLVEHGFELKLNSVIMHGINTQDIIPLAELARDYPVAVRFIEEMPFNGGYKENVKMYNARQIFADLKEHFPGLEKLPGAHGDTADLYSVPGVSGHCWGDRGFFPNLLQHLQPVADRFERGYQNLFVRRRVFSISGIT